MLSNNCFFEFELGEFMQSEIFVLGREQMNVMMKKKDFLASVTD